MRYLLDTHIWLWQLLEPHRLSGNAASALDDPDSELFLSPISVWETLVLARKGRLALELDPEPWVRRALQVSPTSMVALTHDIAIQSETLESFPHADPADRFLVASCLVLELTMITADRALLEYRPLSTIW